MVKLALPFSPKDGTIPHRGDDSMAHIKKISISAAPNMIAHVFRQPQKEEYPFYKTRFHVNDDLSNLNGYHFSNGIDSPEKVFDGYIEELHKCKMQKRSDINTIVSVVVHLPQDVEAGTEEEKLFFDETRKFLQARWEDTYLADAIHRDENRPHMHYLLIPKVNEIKNEKVRDPKTGKLKKTGRKIETGRKKISVKELISRDDVTRFHNDLNEHMKKVFGREIEILNGITAENGGNKTVSELKLNTARKNAEAAKIAAEKEKEQYRELSANFDQARAKKIQEFEQRERKISEAEASVAKAQGEAAKTLQEANAKGKAADAKAAQLRQEEAQLRQRLKAATDAQAKADKKIADAEEQRRAADDALATAKEKMKAVQIREKSVSEREAALEETRPDIKATRLGSEIKAIETQLQSPDLKPITREEMADIAKSTADPRYATLAKQLKDLKITEKQGFKDMQRTHEISRVQSEMTNIFNIYFDDEKLAVANAKYKELQAVEHEKDQKRQELTEKLVIKRREYEYNNSGAAAWLMENASEWPLVAQKIEEVRREKQAVSEQEKPRQTEVKTMPKVKERGGFER